MDRIILTATEVIDYITSGPARRKRDAAQHFRVDLQTVGRVVEWLKDEGLIQYDFKTRSYIKN